MSYISPRVFIAIQNLDIKSLSTYPEYEIRAVLPSLVRMSLLSPLDNSYSSMESRKQILALLIGIEIVNSIVSYLQVNYHELEIELKKELQMRQKALYYENEPSQFGLQTGIALGFERADVTQKVRVVLSEVFNVQWKLADPKAEQKTVIQTEIFDDGIYLEEVIDILCISLAELPSLLNILELTDILLNVENGQRIICALVANFPDYYKDVVTHVIYNCDEESPDGKSKLLLLTALSDMNPSQALSTRAICVETLKVPSFMLKLSLKYPQDLIAFISGMLLGNDQVIRSWFAVFIRTSQKRKGDALFLVREELLQQLQILIKVSKSLESNDDYTVQGVVILRLYCALRGIAGLKFNDDEINLLSQLVTSRPLPTPSGLRFVSLALCTLIACPSLLSTTVLENKSVEWLQWLIKEDAFFGKKSDTTTSLDEMLLLLGIHFHGNQISAIGELVCSTLAMKIPIRPNSTNKIKQVFTQDLFTEQVIASHAVRVPVTVNLNANIPGYLPVHCIHQLLKSRTFLKHKVPIKYWIYKQICNSVRPLHPVMPALIEVYVNSLIVANTSGKTNADNLNMPFSEDEIVHIFKASQTIPTLNKFVYKSQAGSDEEHIKIDVKCCITSQLLILYYLVLYEDTRLANIGNTAVTTRKLKEYSNSFLSELPMKYLLQKAQKNHESYIGLFHPLLRLIICNYPHLSMVEDWLEDHYLIRASKITKIFKSKIKEEKISNAIENVSTKPAKAIDVFKYLLKLPAEDLCEYSRLIVKHLPTIFVKKTPRLIQELYKDIWIHLNSVLPISFWKLSIDAIMGSEHHTSHHSFFMDDNLADPLFVLRCKKSTLHSPYILMIVLRILQGSLAASKAYLHMKIQSKPIFDKNGQIQCDSDREDLKTSLYASQESAAVHMLLEVLADLNKNTTPVACLELREIEGIICSFIHQSFISEPSLAKLVHFQTYPLEVIPMIVMGVPSMHICIDFLHEFLSMPEIDKQIFTIDLASHLALKYSIPKSLTISKFCINTINTTLTLLSTNLKCKFLSSVVPALLRFADAFPVLIDDCINILMVTGRSLYSQGTLGCNKPHMQSISNCKCCKDTKQYIFLIEEAFKKLLTQLLSKIDLY